jgi:DNA processing protein
VAVVDDQARDALAGLSFHVGRALPASLIPVAQAHGARIGSWAYPGALAVPRDDGQQAVQVLREFGRSLRRRAAAAGISMLVRGEAGWPAGTECDVLPCLWVRGNTDVAGLLKAAVAVTSTRACTEYGAQTAADLAAGLAVNGWTVVTNAGFGIDMHAVNAALAIEGPPPVLLTAGENFGHVQRHGDAYRWVPLA